METTNYGFSKVVSLPFAEAIAKVKEVLALEGFGQLTEIDVQTKMKEKVGADMEPYVILGMCNPSLAYQALQIETEIGLLLPCNVIVYEKDGIVRIAVQKPSLMSRVVGKEALKPVVDEAEIRMLEAMENIE
ncbi:MAG: DUF302 domain-containing protein [Candidatus Moranbacteria bacterium]|nr:DUF302 domain-containing protein [Candidatus Moranbacteria bacterium]OIQ04488.1 MAG: hypothetical protein AUK58_00390 [Candidatus Moranbacteria bacterium CG2_30_41_165]PIP25334.1 MAG: ABC transporter ATP-binding protein [Candidatus Moranbacteria bacterium CG23_combo_of_CG06-09_8_20_14_all_41_28]PIV86109.1 MAG: ABC transporter ATP-binding protein [Candidatus Moranbacteria bacterium CG17_big_fil_post_rev_8_21_14_2_50_41_107]PIW93786.1 MAG: ABC transporter ATP-binding protein [Candidatus Moranb